LYSTRVLVYGGSRLFGGSFILAVEQSSHKDSDTEKAARNADGDIPEGHCKFKAHDPSGGDEKEAEKKPELRNSFVDWQW